MMFHVEHSKFLKIIDVLNFMYQIVKFRSQITKFTLQIIDLIHELSIFNFTFLKLNQVSRETFYFFRIILKLLTFIFSIIIYIILDIKKPLDFKLMVRFYS